MIEVSHSHESDSETHFVTLSGAMDPDVAKAMLRLLWKDPDYRQSVAVIYDAGGLDALPDLNAMLGLSRYAVTHKRRRGPEVIAFVGPGFRSAGIKNVFAGFAKVVGLSLNFCASEAHACALIAAATPEK